MDGPMDKDKLRFCDGRRLFVRSEHNPLLRAEDWPYPVNTVFNAGAVRLRSGETLLLARCEDLRGLSHLCAARSENGVDRWQIDPHPTLEPAIDTYPEEVWGIEDPRITYVGELKKYVIAYTAYSAFGAGVTLTCAVGRCGGIFVTPPQAVRRPRIRSRLSKRTVFINTPFKSSNLFAAQNRG